MSHALKWSANGVAALRAAAFLEERAHRHDDHLSVDFVDGPLGVVATTPVLRKLAWRYANQKIPGIYFMHIARTRYFDARVSDAVRRGVRQYVILGAGLDSRAYRLVGPDVRVFEVDLPANCVAKRARVEAVLGELPPHVSQVPADLTDLTGMEAALRLAGWDPTAPTVFTLEGVSMYLPAGAFRALVAWMGAQRAELVLDWFGAEAVRTAGGASWAMRRHFVDMAARGEPYTLGLTVGEVAVLANACGLHVLDAVEGVEVDRAWLDPSVRDAAPKTVGFLGLAHIGALAA